MRWTKDLERFDGFGSASGAAKAPEAANNGICDTLRFLCEVDSEEPEHPLFKIGFQPSLSSKGGIVKSSKTPKGMP